MNLIVVESPTKSKTLAKFLGKDYVIEATMGHIKDLPKSKLGVEVEKKFKPDYQEVEKRQEQVEIIKKAAQKAREIYLATDPDREGEAIASHIKEVIGNGKTKRIVFHEITPQAVEAAIAHPRKIDQHLVDAQVARRVLDRLVGYKLSPLLWKKVRRGLSAGRVQTVAVRLIVEREREIQAFKPQEYWEIFCQVKPKQGTEFLIQLVKVGEKKAEIKNQKEAQKITSELKKAKYVVLEVKQKEVHKAPYAPFTTSTMTQAAARLFGWSAKRTMSLAQKLYERGLITYHRTDSLNIAQSALAETRKLIEQEYGSKYLSPELRIYKTKSKTAQEAHEAIRPTKVKRQEVNLKKAEMKKLYTLIWQRMVASQMASAVFDETRIEVKASKYQLRASGQVMKFEGWRKLFKRAEDQEQTLPQVKEGDDLKLIKVDPQQKFTQPPARFNEASLIKTLEQLGIGRPSTYAPIISTIQVRQYVEKKEGKFFATPVGMAVNDFLLPNFPKIFEYGFTAEMEGGLDGVAQGKLKWQTEIAKFYQPFAKTLATVEKKAKRVKIETEKLGKKCPECKKGELVVRVGRFGKFVSCSTFPECKYTQKYEERIGLKCPGCKEGHVIIKKTNKGRQFFGCSRYPDCEWASWKDPRILSKKPK